MMSAAELLQIDVSWKSTMKRKQLEAGQKEDALDVMHN